MSKVLDELHKIREKHYEETKHLSPKELADHINKEGKEAAKKLGIEMTPLRPTFSTPTSRIRK